MINKDQTKCYLRVFIELICVYELSCVRLFAIFAILAIPWVVARQVPLSMQFYRQKYLSGLLCHPPAYLPNPGIKPRFPVSPTKAAGFSTMAQPEKLL